MGCLVNLHSACSNNSGLFINQHSCLILFSGLPQSSSCSTLSQHTALTLSYLTTTQRTLVLLFVLHTRIFLLQNFVLCVGTILLLVASLRKSHFSVSFREKPDPTLMVKPVARPRFATPESRATVLLVGTPSYGAKPSFSNRPLVTSTAL